MYYLKRVMSILLVVAMLGMLSACVSSEPCDSCGDIPTRGYANTYSNETEYYCSDCSSDCTFCPKDANMHYISGAGIIIFVCDECYEE